MNIEVRVTVRQGYKRLVDYERAVYTIKYHKPADLAIRFLEEFDKIMKRIITRRIK